MQNKRFTKNDQGFACEKCGEPVAPLKYSSRNHCPVCLYSVHLDIMPGDRLNSCGGILRPVSAQPDSKKGRVINFKCEKCGGQTRNKAAKDDNSALLIKLTNPENHNK